jgi:hypothetical protein
MEILCEKILYCKRRNFKMSENKNTVSLEDEIFENSVSPLEDEVDDSDDSKYPTPMKAIRAKCLDCCLGQYGEVKSCTCTDCPLYNFRLGKNPNRKKSRVMSEEQKLAAKDRLAKARAAKKKIIES